MPLWLRDRARPTLPLTADQPTSPHDQPRPAPPRPSSAGSDSRRRSASWRHRRWDAIVIGAGHNGLTCAAYLARAGGKVLVLESRERVGGACTMEEPWPGVRMSPCAYVAGLLHQRVIDELDLPAHGFRWMPAVGGLFVPFEDGSSIQLWNDDAKLRGGGPAFRSQGPRGMARDAGREAAAPRRAPSARRRRPVARSRARPRRDRAAASGRSGGAVPPVRVVHGRDGRALPGRRADAARLSGAGCDRHQRESRTTRGPRRYGTTTPRAGCSGSRARGATSRAVWGWCPSSSATSRAGYGATVAAGVPVARIIPGEGVELASGERIARAARHLQRRSDRHAGAARQGGRRGMGRAGARACRWPGSRSR